MENESFCCCTGEVRLIEINYIFEIYMCVWSDCINWFRELAKEEVT